MDGINSNNPLPVVPIQIEPEERRQGKQVNDENEGYDKPGVVIDKIGDSFHWMPPVSAISFLLSLKSVKDEISQLTRQLLAVHAVDRAVFTFDLVEKQESDNHAAHHSGHKSGIYIAKSFIRFP